MVDSVLPKERAQFIEWFYQEVKQELGLTAQAFEQGARLRIKFETTQITFTAVKGDTVAEKVVSGTEQEIAEIQAYFRTVTGGTN